MTDKQLILKIVAPNKEVFSGVIKYLLITTPEGKKGILSGHENCVEVIVEGDFKVLTDAEEIIFSSAGGSLFLADNTAVIMSESVDFAGCYEEMLNERREELGRRYSEELKSEADLQRMRMALRRSLIRN